MAFVSSSFSNRKLQGRRFTSDVLTDAVEAFTSTIDIQGFEVLTDDRYIPTGSAGNEAIPFSGSSQDGYYYTTGSTIETSAGNHDVLRYWHRHKLYRGSDGSGEVYFFQSSEPGSPSTSIGSDQLVATTQQTNFISNKNADGTLGSGDAEDSQGLGLAYNVVVYASTTDDPGSFTSDDKVDPADYVFDYKTGILSFTEGNEIAGSNYVYVTAYQYVGRTLKSQLNDGSLGGGGGDTVSLHISASEGTGFSLANNATSSFESGSAGITVTATSATNKITIGASTDNVTFNTVNASIINADKIEASEYIVSSSVNYITQSFSSGSTIFGNSLDDTHLITGSLKLTGSLIADIPTSSTSERTPLVIDSNGNITISDEDYITAADAEVYVLDITSSGDDGKISITNSEGLIISGAGGLDVTSDTNTLTFTIGNGILSSSAQIATDISGAINAATSSLSSSLATDIATNLSSITDLQSDSSSFSTRITTLEGNEVHTAAAISGSTRIYVSGSNGGFDVGQDSTLNFVSGTAGLTVVSNGSDTITIGASTDDVTFNNVTADLTGTATKIDLSAVAGSSNELPIILSKAVTPADQIGFTQAGTGIKFTYNPGLGKIKIGSSNLETTYGTSEIQGGSSLPLYTFKINTNESAVAKTEIGSSTSNVVIGNTLFISGSSISTDETSFSLINDTATTLNVGGAATTINMGAATGTVNIAGSASIAGDLIVQGAVTSINTTELNVEDQFILLNSGSNTLQDSGIIISSGPNNSGSAFYYDADSNRWSLTSKNTTAWNATSETPKQYVVSVSASTAAPPTNPLDFGDTGAYYGMMHVNTDTGDIYIYS